MRKSKMAVLASGAAFALGLAVGSVASAADAQGHFAANSNFDATGGYMPNAAGFNLADVSSVGTLDGLPAGVKGLVWLGKCSGADAELIAAVQPYIGHPKLFGFYLMDEPDPGTVEHPVCTPDRLKAEADWIHAHAAGARTFIVLRNMGSSRSPSFDASYQPASSHIDLFGIAPYPCRAETPDCDYAMIDRYLAAAIQAGIPLASIIPIYQAFGGGKWLDDEDAPYRMPTAGEARQILRTWQALVPAPVFDYVFSWGSQNADAALEGAAELRQVFSVHNAAVTSAGAK